jgi:hypothetical protein
MRALSFPRCGALAAARGVLAGLALSATLVGPASLAIGCAPAAPRAVTAPPAPTSSTASAPATSASTVAVATATPPAAPATPAAPAPCFDLKLDRAARLHACAEACLAPDAAACVARGELGLEDDGHVAQRLSADFFDRGCHYGAEAGCQRWQGMVDAARASCSPTSTDACLLQGEMVTSALSAKELDVATADASLATACALNIALACELRGTLDVVREPAETWAKVALSSFERGCTLGSSRACCGAADMIDESRGAKRDPPRTEKLRARASSLGAACGRAGGAARPRGIRTTETALSADGGLSLAAVQPVVRSAEGQLRACYERALARDPGLQGAVTVRFAVDGSGDPNDVRTVSTTLADADLVSCVRVVYDTLTFPAPTGGGATVTVGVGFALE